MKKCLIPLVSLFLLCFLPPTLLAGIAGKAVFLGINPSVTMEPFYQKGEFDINVFPLVYQQTLSGRIDFRISAIVNYGIREDQDTVSHYGGQAAFPMYWKRKADLSKPSEGFFCAPGIGITRNRIERHSNIGLWIEPGYGLMISDDWSIAFGVQWGMTHFNYDTGIRKWGNHFGIKIVVGKWF